MGVTEEALESINNQWRPWVFVDLHTSRTQLAGTGTSGTIDIYVTLENFGNLPALDVRLECA